MRRHRSSVGFALLFGFALVLQAAAGQDEPQTAGTESSGPIDPVALQRKAESALDRIKRNDVGQGIVDATYYIEMAAHVERGRAIPALEAYFARSHESDLRSEIASVLVSLGDEDPQYWNLILRQAQSALSKDPPDPFGIGEAIRPTSPCTSETFLNWAKNRNLTSDEACREATLDIPGKFRPLADTGDQRAIPVLQEGLKARNSLIQGIAASGLVLTRDRDAITFVIEAIERAPQEQARLLADILIESDDPRAESVVHEYEPNMPNVNFPEAHQFRLQLRQWRRPILISK
jgi:hypothetical protein